MLTGRRYRLVLPGGQQAYAETVGAACRYVWNIGLEQRRESRRRGAWISAARHRCRHQESPAAYTSQTCSRRRGIDPESRESQAAFRCTDCGYPENADVNAAKISSPPDGR
ncbi:zinc ribbon domain-containing protein [Nocardia terrae]|uniref:zinc ribbon domain-containing protein n=1 Tax=Nocardia terrae TaxID=2675851 RepID=UPI0018DF4D2D|nr:zinc ribbon domain-containing protein [Nocardia terrae]